ncbi:MAG: hypothetical protein ACM3ML_03855 [Micromonosporaceae bacterium]
MSARAEQYVLEYLSRVADAAQGVLRSDERLAFITRLRASIERQRQAAGAYELAQVRRLLSKFGEPRTMVARERRRLDAPAGAATAVDGATAADAATATRTAANGGAPGGAGRRFPEPLRPRQEPEARPWRPADSLRTRRQVVPAARERPVIRVGHTGAIAPEQPRAPQPGLDPWSAARRFRREALALVLIGPGAIVLPFPLWLIGAAIGLTSWVWSVRDKSIGLAGPFLVTAAGVGLIGALNKNPSIPIDLHAYLSAAHADAGILIRVSAALGALYLGARLLRRDKAAKRRSADR